MASPREGDNPSHLANEQPVADVAPAGEHSGGDAEASAAASKDTSGKAAGKGKAGVRGRRDQGKISGEAGGGDGEGGTAQIAAECEELPRAVVRRIVKAKVQELMQEGGALWGVAGAGGEGSGRKKEVQVAKDALVALTESARVFIHYLTSTANDWCRSNKRQTVSAADVLASIEDIQFPEFLPALQSTLQALRDEKSVKRKGKLEKREAAAAVAGGTPAEAAGTPAAKKRKAEKDAGAVDEVE
ncbi:hypothetical protein CLOM_g12895 [Closterium sp. NIES-68]|nr:hypothetical protein CLOM_g12895 [Closterium sp. NIES-68]GJP83148.1 hypothetical protein CLOP_g13343 [Closterium sp. NIES-67]